MKTSTVTDAMSALLRHLNSEPPDWLLPGERIAVTVHGLAFSEDSVTVRATLESPTRWRETMGRLDGRLIRMFNYTGRQSVIVGAVSDLYDELVNRLRLVIDHPLKALACQALNDDESLTVFMDAIIERGEIRHDGPDVREQAEGFALSIVAPLIFPEWQTERWPLNHDLIDTGLEWQGRRIHSRGPLTGAITKLEIRGGMAIAEST